MSLYFGVCGFYTAHHSFHLHYPCIFAHPPWLLDDVLGGCDRASLEIHLEDAIMQTSSAKNISVRVEWLCQSGRALSEPSETPWWRITLRLASIPRVTLQIALRSLFQHFFSLCWSPILNEYSGVVANSDCTLELVHWVRACIGIGMRWVTLQKSLLALLLPARKMQFSFY